MEKKFYPKVVFALILSALVFVNNMMTINLGAQTEKDNLITNPGFENDADSDGKPDGWVGGEWTNLYAVSGTHSYQMVGAAENNWKTAISDWSGFAAKQNCKYRFSCYCKNNAKQGEIKMAVRKCRVLPGKPLDTIGYDWVIAKNGTDWQKYEAEFTASAETARFMIFLIMDKVDGTAWFDDVSLVELGSAETKAKEESKGEKSYAQMNLVQKYQFQKKYLSGMSPALEWILSQKIKGTYYRGMHESHLVELKEAGLNTLLPKHSVPYEKFAPESHRQGIDAIKNYTRLVEKYQMHYIPGFNFDGGDADAAYFKDKYNIRRVVYSDGRVGNKPCPLEETFWKDFIGKKMEDLAVLSKENPAIQGCYIDTEMYMSNAATIYGQESCFCQKCFSDFCQSKNLPDYKKIEANQRFEWLKSKGMLNEYYSYQTEGIARTGKTIEEKIHRINPNFIIGFLNYCDTWYYRGLIKGFGTKPVPVWMLSEETYSGYLSNLIEGQTETSKNQGDSVIYLPGLSIYYLPPVDIENQDYYSAISSFGYWLYETDTIRGESPASYGQKLLGPRENYWAAIKKANDEIEKWLAKKGDYVSELNLSKERPVIYKLISEKGMEKEPQLVPLSQEETTVFYAGMGTKFRDLHKFLIYVKKGEKIKFGVLASQLNSNYMGGTSFVLLDPEMNQVFTGVSSFREKEAVNEIAVKNEGVYTLLVSSERNGFYCKPYNQYAVINVLNFRPLHVFSETEEMYFYVPEKIQKFSLFLQAWCYQKTVTLDIKNPEGKTVFSKDDPFAKREEISITVPPGCGGKVWSFNIYKPGSTKWGEARLYFSPAIPPYISNSAKRLLIIPGYDAEKINGKL